MWYTMHFAVEYNVYCVDVLDGTAKNWVYKKSGFLCIEISFSVVMWFVDIDSLSQTLLMAFDGNNKHPIYGKDIEIIHRGLKSHWIYMEFTLIVGVTMGKKPNSNKNVTTQFVWIATNVHESMNFWVLCQVMPLIQMQTNAKYNEMFRCSFALFLFHKTSENKRNLTQRQRINRNKWNATQCYDLKQRRNKYRTS